MKSKNKISIKSLELYLLKLPLVNEFTTGFGTIKTKETVLVKMTDIQGLVGWGEAPGLSEPLYTYETCAVSLLALEKYLAPLVIGKTFSSPEELRNQYSRVRGYNFAKGALENAFWMLFSLQQGRSLSFLLGGTRKKIGVGESIGIKKTIQKTLNEIDKSLERGYQRIKIKIRPGWDVKVVAAIRSKYPKINLMVDGNSAYSLNDLEVLKELDKYNLTMMEQPLGHDDIIDHARLQHKLKTPICLDESINSVNDALKAISIGACKIINIKPARVGGLWESRKIHDLAQKNQVGVWCGGYWKLGSGDRLILRLPRYQILYIQRICHLFIFFTRKTWFRRHLILIGAGLSRYRPLPDWGLKWIQKKLKNIR